MTGQIQELDRALQVLQFDYKQVQNTKAQLQANVDQFTVKYQELNHAHASLQHQYAELKNQTSQNLQAEKQRLIQLEQLNAQLSKHHETLHSQLVKQNEQLQLKLNQLTQENERLNQELIQIQVRERNAEKSRKDMAQEFEILKTQIMTCTAEIEKLEKINQELESRNTDLQTKLTQQQEQFEAERNSLNGDVLIEEARKREKQMQVTINKLLKTEEATEVRYPIGSYSVLEFTHMYVVHEYF